MDQALIGRRGNYTGGGLTDRELPVSKDVQPPVRNAARLV